MTIVPALGLVLDVAGVNGDLPGLLLGSAIDILVCHCLTPSFLAQHLGDGLGQSSLHNGTHCEISTISKRSVTKIATMPMMRQ